VLKPEDMVTITSSLSELANRKPSSCTLLLVIYCIELILSFQTRNDLDFVHALIIGLKDGH
jgi:hypothetical protein